MLCPQLLMALDRLLLKGLLTYLLTEALGLIPSNSRTRSP